MRRAVYRLYYFPEIFKRRYDAFIIMVFRFLNSFAKTNRLRYN